MVNFFKLSSIPVLVVAGGEVKTEMKLQAPTLSEEDQFSSSMPKQYKCDGCVTIAYHLSAVVNQHKNKFKKRVNEEDAMDVTERACSPTTYAGYGIVLDGGKNTFSGPALPPKERPQSGGSIMLGGEMWSNRLASRCVQLVDDIGEVEIVEAVLESGGLEALVPRLCAKDCTKASKARVLSRATNTTTTLVVDSSPGDADILATAPKPFSAPASIRDEM